jgi:hypothetical protein
MFLFAATTGSSTGQCNSIDRVTVLLIDTDLLELRAWFHVLLPTSTKWWGLFGVVCGSLVYAVSFLTCVVPAWVGIPVPSYLRLTIKSLGTLP